MIYPKRASARGPSIMRLLYTTDAFSHHGVQMVGVPVVLDDEMHIVEGPQRWLFYIALERGRTRSPATWRGYSEALYDWLQTCQVNGWVWNKVEEGHLRAIPREFGDGPGVFDADRERAPPSARHVLQLGFPARTGCACHSSTPPRARRSALMRSCSRTCARATPCLPWI